MSECVIEPLREKGEPELPENGLLVINPVEARYAGQFAERQQGRRHFLFNSQLYVVDGKDKKNSFFIAGPAVGAPMAVLALEKLIALGAKRLIVFSWCGSLTPGLQVGDILLPTWAVSEEGTSPHYPVQERPESAASLRIFLQNTLQNKGQKISDGAIWTTDAPYRETKEKIEQYGSQGVLGVDMEFSALCTVAAFRSIDLAAVMLVSDELYHTEWRPGFRDKKFKRTSKTVLESLAACCQSLAG